MDDLFAIAFNTKSEMGESFYKADEETQNNIINMMYLIHNQSFISYHLRIAMSNKFDNEFLLDPMIDVRSLILN